MTVGLKHLSIKAKALGFFLPDCQLLTVSVVLNGSEASVHLGKRVEYTPNFLPNPADSSDLRSFPSAPASERLRMTPFFVLA
jgi:hypothetical protein